ncbi:MAG: immune inhibitor A domain-containing protein [Nocardioides sp.]
MSFNHPSRGRRALILASSACLALGVVATTVASADAKPGGKAPHARSAAGPEGVKSTRDNFGTPLMKKQDAMRQVALQQRVEGKASAQKSVVKLAKGQYVDLDNEGTDKIFVVLVEFGDNQYTGNGGIFTGPPPDGSATDVTGPLNNEIPEPNRAVDNSTLWQADYNREHYQDMYFNRMKEYYETQSTGRYSVDGTVTDWVKVPFNEALYGRDYCGSIVCNTSKALVRDALAVWVKAQLDAGMTMPQITDYLKTFDHQDRYDIDADGIFDEPDGVIDHFQIVHAGGDEAAGDPNQGSDAIWSHRSGANIQAGGPLGSGVDIGSNGGFVSSDLVPNNPTGIWVYDYTMQPENGGLGVFSHEFGHDLGLPDLYDTSGNTGGAENNTAFWTLMSSGANIGDGSPDGIGDAPTDMGAWERLQLGWLDAQGSNGPFYQVVQPGEHKSVQLGPNTPNTKKPSALITLLPDKDVTVDIGAPATGDYMFWSGQGNNLDNTMTHAVTGGATAVTAKVRYDIEEDWDYGYLEASSDGTNFTPVPTNLSTNTNPNGQNFGEGITGSTAGAWVDFTATLPAGTTAMRFRYWTDVAAVEAGLKIDDITLGGQAIGTGETADEGWTFDGFNRQKQQAVEQYFNAYIAENRQYDGYDTSLATAYNFGFLGTAKDNWVETHPYMPGLLVTYWDGSAEDNNVGEHPGSGLILPVDAHPQFSHWPDGTLMRNRILSYDSTFGLTPTAALTLHLSRFDANGNYAETMTGTVPSRPGVSTFDDRNTFWFASDGHTSGPGGSHPGRYQPGWYSVDVPKTGTTIRVVSQAKHGAQLNLKVN